MLQSKLVREARVAQRDRNSASQVRCDKFLSATPAIVMLNSSWLEFRAARCFARNNSRADSRTGGHVAVLRDVLIRSSV